MDYTQRGQSLLCIKKEMGTLLYMQAKKERSISESLLFSSTQWSFVLFITFPFPAFLNGGIANFRE